MDLVERIYKLQLDRDQLMHDIEMFIKDPKVSYNDKLKVMIKMRELSPKEKEYV